MNSQQRFLHYIFHFAAAQSGSCKSLAHNHAQKGRQSLKQTAVGLVITGIRGPHPTGPSRFLAAHGFAPFSSYVTTRNFVTCVSPHRDRESVHGHTYVIAVTQKAMQP
jgi:hypothetical protein